MGPGADLVRLALARAGRFRFRAHGSSMRPVLDDGDVVALAPVRPEQIRIGDVVCFERPPGGLVLHRVIDRKATCLVTRGAALGWAEEVTPECVLGRVTAVERRGKLERIVTRLVRLASRLRRAGDAATGA